MLTINKGNFIANEHKEYVLNRALENSFAMLLIFAKAAWIMTRSTSAKR